jgi:hypothetical protein
MTEHRGELPINELKATLAAYEEARRGWREVIILFNGERKTRGLEGTPVEINNERHLYRFARSWTDTAYIGKVPEDDFAQLARAYLLTVDRLSKALENLSQHLNEISRENPPDSS